LQEPSTLLRRRANAAGAQFLIAKPFSVDAIRKAVGRLDG